MTSRCYFGKMNSILGSVVPLAMFFRVFVLAFVLRFVFVRAFGNVLFLLAVGRMMIDQAALCIH